MWGMWGRYSYVSNNWSCVISSCKRCAFTSWREEKNKKIKKFLFNQFHYAFPTLNWIKFMSSWRKRDWWILWIDFEVNYKDIDHDIPSYPKQKQVTEKAYRADRKHKEKKPPKMWTMNTSIKMWNSEKILTQEKSFATLLSAAVFGTVTGSKVNLITAAMFSTWLLLSWINFELTNYLGHQQLQYWTPSWTENQHWHSRSKPKTRLSLAHYFKVKFLARLNDSKCCETSPSYHIWKICEDCISL